MTIIKRFRCLGLGLLATLLTLARVQLSIDWGDGAERCLVAGCRSDGEIAAAQVGV